MQRRQKVLVGIAAGAGVVALGAGIAVATGATDTDEDEQDVPITGSVLDEASRIAVEHVGEGRVTDTEVGDEDSYYEVEVTRADGSQVDVQLDEDLSVVSSEADQEDDGQDR